MKRVALKPGREKSLRRHHPWVFSGETVTRETAADFLLEYVTRMQRYGKAPLKASASRIKQLLRYWTAGDFVGEDRTPWLREQDPERLMARIQACLPEMTS